MDWYSELWLNEGFARFCEFNALDGFHPQRRMDVDMVAWELIPAMIYDSSDKTHPMLMEGRGPLPYETLYD